MKRRRIILCGGLLLVAALLVLLWPRGPKEPVYEGKPLSAYLEKTYWSWDPDQTTKAHNAVKTTSAQSLPYLMFQFAREDSQWRPRLNLWLARSGLGRFQFKVRSLNFHPVAGGLRALGPEAAPALPTLARYLGHPQKGTLAAWIMSGCDTQAVPYFRRACNSTNHDALKDGLQGLIYLTHNSDAGFQPLIELMTHTNRAVRRTTALFLGKAYSGQQRFVPTLIATLSDPDPSERLEAISTLSRLWGHAKPAVPDLLRLMQDSDPDLWHAASNSLFRIDPTALPAPKPLP